jgi:hypothetical protein
VIVPATINDEARSDRERWVSACGLRVTGFEPRLERELDAVGLLCLALVKQHLARPQDHIQVRSAEFCIGTLTERVKLSQLPPGMRLRREAAP